MTEMCLCAIIAKVMRMKEIFKQTLLFDFYGELLTDHQKDIYKRYLFEDLSQSEIAEEEGISRQAAHDMIKRCEASLDGYEKTLHLVDKFMAIKDKVKKIDSLLEECEKAGNLDGIKAVRQYASEITEEL